MVHGLFGSGSNWGVIARKLSDIKQVRTVDLRNHCESNLTERHRHCDVAADLTEVIAAAKLPMDLRGHFMGGKAAILLAQTRPKLVHLLIVGDIAPVVYGHY